MASIKQLLKKAKDSLKNIFRKRTPQAALPAVQTPPQLPPYPFEKEPPPRVLRRGFDLIPEAPKQPQQQLQYWDSPSSNSNKWSSSSNSSFSDNSCMSDSESDKSKRLSI